MDVIFALLFLLLLFSNATMWLIIFFHEMGHAIGYAVLTKGTIKVFVGSYGNEPESYQLRIGRFWLYFYKKWRAYGGLTKGPSTTQARDFIITLAGPLMSLCIGLGLFRLIYVYPFSFWPTLYLGIYGWHSIYDFSHILRPSEHPIRLDDGSITYNDGHQIRETLFQRSLRKEAENAAPLFEQDKLAYAQVLEGLAKKRFRQFECLKMAGNIYAQQNQLERALEIETKIACICIDEDTFLRKGLYYVFANRLEDAKSVYEQGLEIYPNSRSLRSNIAFSDLQLGHYGTSKQAFENLLTEDPDDCYLLSNLVFAQYRLGETEDPKPELLAASEKAPTSQYALRNLAIYYYEKKRHEKALEYFEKALKIDPNTYECQKYIRKIYTSRHDTA